MPSENGSEDVGQKQGAKTWGKDKGQIVNHLIPTGIPKPQHNRREIFGVNCLERHIPHGSPISFTGYALRTAQEFLLKPLHATQIKLILEQSIVCFQDYKINYKNNQFF